jgi:hypothetical protein
VIFQFRNQPLKLTEKKYRNFCIFRMVLPCQTTREKSCCHHNLLRNTKQKISGKSVTKLLSPAIEMLLMMMKKRQNVLFYKRKCLDEDEKVDLKEQWLVMIICA